MSDKTEQIIKVIIDSDEPVTASDINGLTDASIGKVYRVIDNLDSIDLIESDKDTEPYEWTWSSSDQ